MTDHSQGLHVGRMLTARTEDELWQVMSSKLPSRSASSTVGTPIRIHRFVMQESLRFPGRMYLIVHAEYVNRPYGEFLVTTNSRQVIIGLHSLQRRNQLPATVRIERFYDSLQLRVIQ